MSKERVHEVSANGFSAVAIHEGDVIVMELRGTADTQVLGALEETLPAVHEAARLREAREVVVDFRALEFMNSSCFKVFVTWLSRVQELEPDQQYQIKFLSDDGKHWQRRSLTALSCFAADLVSIES
jgi:anti-anti-sigma factor